MRNYKSLKKFILSVMLISMLLIISFMSISFLILYKDAEEQNLNLAKDNVSNADSFIQTFFTDIDTAYTSIAYSDSVYNFLTQEDSLEKWKSCKTINSQATTIKKYNNNILDIMLIKNDDEHFSFLEYIKLPYKKIIYNNDVDKKILKDIKFYRTDEKEYILFIYPVYDIVRSVNFIKK